MVEPIRLTKKEVDTFTAQIYLGLREGYGTLIHNEREVREVLQDYVNNNKFCVTITPTEFIYTSNLKKSVNGNEQGVIIGIMNYPRFPLERKTLEQKAEEIALLCKERFKQNKISIVYPDRTVMFETPEENK